VDRRSAHPTRAGCAVVLGGQAGGLTLAGAGLLAVGPATAGLVALLGAAILAGLAVSIREGLPDVGRTVLGVEGATVATGLAVVSPLAALGAATLTAAGLGWARRRGGAGQMRRPVPSQ